MDDALSRSRWLSAHLDSAVRVGDNTTPVEPLLQALRHSPRSTQDDSSSLTGSAEYMGGPNLVTALAASSFCHRNRGDRRSMEPPLTDMNKCNPVTGQQPLHVAVHLGHRLLARALLLNGADVNGRANPPPAAGGGRSPPDHRTGSCSFPLTLLRGMTALHWAALRGYWEIVEDLLSCGADLEARVAESGETPLHLAARHQQDAVVGVLLDAGADPLALSRFNLTPMDLAALSNNPGTLHEFLSRGVDPNSKNALGYTAVHQAAYSSSTATLRLLLECGGSVRSATEKGYTPLHVAAAVSPRPAAARSSSSPNNSSEKEGSLSTASSAVRTIALYGGESLDVDAVDADGATPLRAACVHLREEAVRDLLEIGADEQLVGGLSQGDFACRRSGKNGCVIGDPLAVGGKSTGAAGGNRIESIARVLAMLALAAKDRAWRRRGWLAVLRARGTTARRASAAARDADHASYSENSVSVSTCMSSSYRKDGDACDGMRRSSQKRQSSWLGNNAEVVHSTATRKPRRSCEGSDLAVGAAAADADAAAASALIALGSSGGGEDPGLAKTVGMMTALAGEEVFRRIVLYL